MKKWNIYKATREIKERDISEIVQGCTFFCDDVFEELIKSCDTLGEAREVLKKYNLLFRKYRRLLPDYGILYFARNL